MKKKLPLIVLLLYSIAAIGQVAGPRSGTYFSTAPLAGSERTWTDVGNAGATDHQFASFGDLKDVPGSHTDYLVVTGFRMNLPANAQVTGIAVYVESSDPDASTSDYSIRLVRRGAPAASDHSSGAIYPGLADRERYRTYGGFGDMWNETWPVAEINSDNFGVAIAAQRAVTGRPTSGRIDNIRIAVYYNTTLPLTLTRFSASLKQGKVQLNWTTAGESDMDRFELQRSASGSDFHSFGTVICTNQRTAANYVFNDYAPLQGTSYYRLKILATDGSVSYSKTVQVNFNAEHAVMLYPSPWKKGTALKIMNAGNRKLVIRFYDHTGQLVTTITSSSDQVPVDNISKTKGILRYKVSDENGEAAGAGTLVVY